LRRIKKIQGGDHAIQMPMSVLIGWKNYGSSEFFSPATLWIEKYRIIINGGWFALHSCWALNKKISL
jgi:hypothetical protein